MSLVGFNKTSNHPQQVGKRGAVDKVDDRETPQELFDRLQVRFGFTIDAAASATNTKLPRYFTREQNGLAQSWADERVWCNPPYSDCGAWVNKAHEEVFKFYCELAVLLLPANRTEQGWWQDFIEPRRDCGEGIRVEFLRGRLRFDVPGGYNDPRGNRPPFGVCLVIFEGLPSTAPARRALRGS